MGGGKEVIKYHNGVKEKVIGWDLDGRVCLIEKYRYGSLHGISLIRCLGKKNEFLMSEYEKGNSIDSKIITINNIDDYI